MTPTCLLNGKWVKSMKGISVKMGGRIWALPLNSIKVNLNAYNNWLIALNSSPVKGFVYFIYCIVLTCRDIVYNAMFIYRSFGHCVCVFLWIYLFSGIKYANSMCTASSVQLKFLFQLNARCCGGKRETNDAQPQDPLQWRHFSSFFHRSASAKNCA